MRFAIVGVMLAVKMATAVDAMAAVAGSRSLEFEGPPS
jgi:hypothetical protein